MSLQIFQIDVIYMYIFLYLGSHLPLDIALPTIQLVHSSYHHHSTGDALQSMKAAQYVWNPASSR